jgi:hypothetical protein
MFGLFKKTPKLSEEAREFIAKLAKDNIWILAVGLRGIPAIASVTDAAAFDIIAEDRMDVSGFGDDDSVFPFNYERNGRQVLPFFSTEERAVQFATAAGFPMDVFQPYELMSGFVGTPENDMFELELDRSGISSREDIIER